MNHSAKILSWRKPKPKRKVPWGAHPPPAWRVLAAVADMDEAEDIQLALRLTRYDLWITERLEKTVEVSHRFPFDVVLLDLELFDSRPEETFARFHTASPDLPVVVIARPEVQDFGSLAILQGARARVLRPQLRSPQLVPTIAEAIPAKKRHRSDRHA